MRGPYFLRPEDPSAGLPHEVEVEKEKEEEEEEEEANFRDFNVPSTA